MKSFQVQAGNQIMNYQKTSFSRILSIYWDQTKKKSFVIDLSIRERKQKYYLMKKVTKKRTAIGTLESDEIFLFKTGAGFYTFDVCFPELGV